MHLWEVNWAQEELRGFKEISMSPRKKGTFYVFGQKLRYQTVSLSVWRYGEPDPRTDGRKMDGKSCVIYWLLCLELLHTKKSVQIQPNISIYNKTQYNTIQYNKTSYVWSNKSTPAKKILHNRWLWWSRHLEGLNEFEKFRKQYLFDRNYLILCW